MRDRFLFRRQLRHGFGQGAPEMFFIGMSALFKQRRAVAGGLVILLPGIATPEKVDGGILRKPQKVGALVSSSGQKFRPDGDTAEKILQQVPGVSIVVREIQKQRKKRRSVIVVKTLQ